MTALKTDLVSDVLVIEFTDAQLRDADRVRQVGAELLQACDAASTGKLLLDFAGVVFITSEMVGQLFVLGNRCKSKDVRLKACHMDGGIRAILETVRLVEFLEIYENRRDALSAFRQPVAGREESEEFAVDPKIFAQSAAEGDVDAELELALCYEQGNGVEQDLDMAMKWLRRAAEHEHPEAQFKLGAAYAYGIYVDQDYDEALRWFRLAAKAGQADAQYALGMSYHYGISVDEDQQAATEWYEKAAAQGHKRAMEILGRLNTASS